MDKQTSESNTNTKSDLSDIIAHENNPKDTYESHLNNDLEVLRQLGKGGFGVVFEVKSKIDHQKYAVKKIKLPNSERSRKRSLREAETHAKCEHENIVRFDRDWIECLPLQQQEESDQTDDSHTNDSSYETDDSDTSDSCFTFEAGSQEELQQTYTEDLALHLCIKMELCVGSLENWQTDVKHDHLFVFDRYQIFYEIIAGVSYLHSKCLIHRDLKPSNILIGVDNTIKIGDFGLVTSTYEAPDDAASCGRSILHTKNTGTALYMAPEQENSQNYDHNVDTYALGIILFELLANFDTGMERAKKLESIRSGEFPDNFSRAFPLQFALVKRMLSTDPAERPSISDIELLTERCYLEEMKVYPGKVGYTHFPKSFFKMMMAIKANIKIHCTVGQY